MKKFLLILLCFSIIFPLTACKKKDDLNEIGKNLSCYEINLDLNSETKQVVATQSLKYVNNTNTVLKTLKFHLYPKFFEEGATEYVIANTKVNNAYPNGMSYADFEVTRIKVEDEEKQIKYENVFNSILIVELNASLMPNEEVEMDFEYEFTLPNSYHRFGYGDNTINFGNFYPIICVYENGEFNTSPYNANGDPFYSDISNYKVNIFADKQYIVAGTGNKTDEKITDGKKITSFCATAVRDFAMVLSKNFDVISTEIDKINIEYYYFNDNHADKSIKAGSDAIKTFSKLFGNYPYSNFSIVQTDFIYGGMEYPNLVMISSLIEDETAYLNVIIHETAHQWWYGVVGNNEFEFPWLDESLTEFSTALFYNYNEGYKLSYNQIINASKDNYSLFISVYEDVLGTIDTSMRAVDKYNTEPEYTYCTYVKGVLMWDSLYSLVGEKNLLKGLKNYYETCKFKNATPDELIDCLNDGCEQNLNNFFSSWINGHVVIK